MGRNSVNRVSFGIALFIVLTMVIPAPSSVFPSLIQPASQVSKPTPFTLPQSLFSAKNAAAFSSTLSFAPTISNSSFTTTNTTPKIAGTTQANTTVKLFDGTTQIGSVTRNLASAGSIFTIGGYNGAGTLNTINEYNPGTNTWSAVAPMPTARMSLASATDLSGNIYAIGGSNAGPLSTVEKYNTATKTWSAVASMPTARQELAAATDLSGNIYAIGGNNGNGTYYNNVEKYNPGTNSWSTVASMPAPSSCLGAVADPSGNIYALGGQFNNAGIPSAFKYNPTTNTWAGIPPIPGPFMPGCPGGVASDLAGNIYVMGGFGVPTAVYQSNVEKYNPGTNTWSIVASLPASDAFFASATDLSGNIYAIGGATPVSSAVYKYDPVANTWSTVASMPLAASNLAASTPFMAKWSIVPSVLSVGIHTIRANATDLAANTSPNSNSITATITVPTVSITSPTNGTTSILSDIAISGTATDSGSGVNNTQVSIDGSTFSLANGTTSWSFTKHGLANGVHTILARATNNAGNNGFSYSTNAIIGSPIPVGANPYGVAYDSANGYLYVTDINDGTILVINGATNTIVPSHISAGTNPFGIAYDSANGYLYVANSGSNSVSVINGATNTVVGSPISVGTSPESIAYDSANGYLYVDNFGSNSVSVINGATNTVVGSPISVGTSPQGIAYDSANGYLYVTNISSNTVSVINGATNTVVGSPISVGSQPYGIAYDSANGNLYVSNHAGNTVSVINGATNTVVGSPISVGTSPQGIAYDSANGNLYVTNYGSNTISVINGTSNTIVGSPISTSTPQGVTFDPVNGYLYATNGAINSVSVISTPTFFTVNIPAPQSVPLVSITSPTNGYLVGTSTPIVIGLSSDVGSTISSVQVSVDGGAYSAATNTATAFSSWSFTTPSLSNGVHTLRANATDALGHSAVSTISLTTYQPATVELGQPSGTAFTSNTANNGGLSASSLAGANIFAFDSSGNLWVTDDANNRVLMYPKSSLTTNGAAATVVLGQPNFISNTANNGGLSASSLATPRSLAFDSSGNLWVTDWSNNRVLMYPKSSLTTNGAAATVVLGQPNFISNTANNGGLSASSLAVPYGIAFDSSGNLWIGDVNNNRVLMYPKSSLTTNGAAATVVLGQPGFTSGASGLSASAINSPRGLAFDSTGDLWLADNANHRVLMYPKSSLGTNGASATVELGQPSGTAFTSNTANNGGLSASSINFPNAVAFDSSGNLWVIDWGNNRVLMYPKSSLTTNGAAATVVLGQPNFISNTANNGGLSASSLASSSSIAFDPSGNLWVTDGGNNRVLQYTTSFTVHVPTYSANTIYALGGGPNSGPPTNQAYNPGTNTWTAIPTEPSEPNGGAAATDLAGNIYLMAGNNSTGTTNSVFKYNPGTNTWTRVASMPFASYRLAATTDLAGNIYAMGGNNGGTYLNNVAKYNVTTNSWSTVASLPVAIEGLRAVTDYTGNIYAIGGYTAAGSLNTVYKYNPGTNSWSTVAPMSTARAVPSVALDSSGNIYAMGGQDVSVGGPIYNTVEKYTPGTNTWTTVAPMPIAKSGGAAATDSSGRIYAMAGGPALFSPYTAEVDKYNSTTNSWSTVAPLPVGVVDLAVVAAPAPILNLPTSTPLVSITSPTNGQLFTTSTVSVTGTSSYAASTGMVNYTISNVQVSVDGGAYSAATNTGTAFSTWSFTTLTLSNGVHTLRANATDTLGHFAVYTIPFTTDQTASIVLGQSGFTSNSPGTTASTLSSPNRFTFDSSGNLWVVDTTNSRVLMYPKSSLGTNGASATVELGQPSATAFTSGIANNGGISASSLQQPVALAFDSSGNLWVADYNNNRILMYPKSSLGTNGASATVELGQPSATAFTSNTANNGGFSASSLASPTALAFDSSGNLWVADRNDNRILMYPKSSLGTNGASATVELGQPSATAFTSNTANNGGLSASSLQNPYMLAFDPNSNLWVADFNNHRVLMYSKSSLGTNGASATVELGQPSATAFTSGIANNGGISASSLQNPVTLAFDPSGNLWISDNGNNRILMYPKSSLGTNGASATVELGQPSATAFTSNTANNGGLSASSLSGPSGTLFDSSGNLWAVDANNNRILEYTTSFTTNVDTIPPTLSITSPANQTTTSTSTVAVSGTASDDTTVSSVTYKVDSGSVSAATSANNYTNWSFTTPSLSNGLHNIFINATDSVGLVTHKLLQVTVNVVTYSSSGVATSATGAGPVSFKTNSGVFYTLAPLPESSQPVSGKPSSVLLPYGVFSFNITGLVSGSTAIVNMTFPAPLAQNAQYWKIQHGSWINATSHVSIVNNRHSMLLTVTDGGFGDSDGIANGNIVDPGAILVPQIPIPHVVITSPANSTTLITSDVVITGTATAKNSTITNIKLSIDGSAFSLANGTTSWSFTKHGLANGIHTILARATDNLGNVGVSYGSSRILGSPIPVRAGPYNIAFDPANGDMYVANRNNNTISVINGTTNTVVATIPIPTPTGIAYDSANGNLYVTNYGSGNVSVINGTTNTVVGSIPISVGFPNGIAFDSTNGHLYATSTTPSAVTVIDGATNTVIGSPITVGLGVNPQDITFDPANGSLYVANYGNGSAASYTVSVINGATNTIVGAPILTGGISPFSIRFDPANGNLYVTNYNGGSVSVINGTTNSVTSTISIPGSAPTGVAFDPSNGYLYVDDGHSAVVTINGTTNSLVGHAIPVGTAPVGIAYDSLNGYLYVTNQLSNTTSVIYTPTIFTVNTVIPPPPADYNLQELSSVSTAQGTTGKTTIQVSSVNGFAGNVNLALNSSSVPAGVLAIFGNSTLHLQSGGVNNTSLSLAVGPAVTPGTYGIQVIGNNGTIIHKSVFSLTVNPSVPPGSFAVSASPVVIVQGSSGPSTVNVTSISGFSSPVTLSLIGAPVNVTGTFASNPITPVSNGQASTVLSLSVGRSVAPGIYNVLVNGTSGSVVHSGNLVLTVSPAVPAGVTSLSAAQPVVLNSNVYTVGSAGTITINSNAGTPTIQVLIRSSSDPNGMLVTLTQSPTSPTVYTSNNQITFTSGNTDYSSNLHVISGDTVYVTYNPSGNVFYLRAANGTLAQQPFGWGIAGDIPITGDWNGDGMTKTGIYRPSNSGFYLRDANGNLVQSPFSWGGAGDIPIVGDWDGQKINGHKVYKVGIYRPSNSGFYLRDANGNLVQSPFSWGGAGDIPIVGDWNGDGKDKVGIYRPSNSGFYLRDANGNLVQSPFSWGGAGDIPVTGDWNGNGITKTGIYRPSTGVFYLRDANGNLNATIGWGQSGDVPVIGDWTVSGKSQVGIYRPVTSSTPSTSASIITNTIPTAGTAVSYTTNFACKGDSSQDGICDEWKYTAPANGLPAGVNIPVNGLNYNFACDVNARYNSANTALGQYNNPLGDKVCPQIGVKDVYVEIDYMTGQQPDPTALTDVVNAFLNHGLHLHLLVDDNMGLHVDSIPLKTILNSDGTVQQTGYFGATGSLGYKNGYKDMFFGTATERADPHATDLLTAKRQFYHYTMSIFNLAGTGGSSGYGEIGGNDMIISLGSFTNHVGSIAEQEGTFMHELGHNLGLDHGGPVNIMSTAAAVPDHALNCKPNYPSVMNYLYQMPSLISGRPLDYSSLSSTNTLSESNLVDSNGIGASVSSGWQAVIGGVDANNNYQSPLIAPFSGGIAFDRSTALGTAAISKNIHEFNIPNCDTTTNNVLTTLNGYNDWNNLNLEFRGSATFLNGIYTINQVDLTPSTLRTIQGQLVASLNGTIESLPDSAFTPNYPPSMKSIFSSELLSVDSAIRSGNLIGTGGAVYQLQNIILPQMTGAGTAATNVLITNPTNQANVSAMVNYIINALNAAATPSATNHSTPYAANETVTTLQNVPVGITLLAADPNNLPLKVNITSPSSGALSPTPTGTNLDFSGFSSMTYVPISGHIGTDQFTYQVKSTDPQTAITRVSNVGTITVITQSTTTNMLTPPPATTTISAGGQVPLSVQIAGSSPTGTVLFSSTSGTFANNPCTLDSHASCSAIFTPTSSGQISVTESYSGDKFNHPSTNSITLTVSKAVTTTTVQLNPSTITVGSVDTVSAQVSGFSPTGTISFSASANSGSFVLLQNTCQLSAGACSVQFTPSSAGSPSINATYSGDTNNMPSSRNSALTVSKYPSTLTIDSLSPSSVAVGSPSTVSVSITGIALPGQSISFTSDGTGTFNSTTCTINSNGKCGVTYTPSVVGTGAHKITASYAGDANNLPSSANTVLAVTQTTSAESISLSPSSIPVGGSSTVSVTVSGIMPSRTVSFTTTGTGQFNSTTCTLVTSSHSGTCAVTYNALAAPGPASINATYSGDSNNGPSSTKVTLIVTQTTSQVAVSLVPSSIPAASPSLAIATVSGFLPTGGHVSFTSNGAGTFNSTTCTIQNNNQCGVQYTPSMVGTGAHKINATYAGDANNLPSSGVSTLTVTRAPTTISSGIAPSSVAVGSPSTVSVSITGIALPGQSISFTSDGTGTFNSTTCTINSNGKCGVTYTPSVVGTGAHKITASYAGDANNLPSSANTVLAVTQTTSSESISLSPSSVAVGSPSTVSVSITGIALPGQSISFTSDGTGTFNSTTCTINSNGKCGVTYTPSVVGTGAHKITASYAGDANNQPSTAQTPLTVTQFITTTTVSLNPSSVAAGSTTAVSVTVTGFSPTGTISLSAPTGSGTFSVNSCSLTNGACSVQFTSSSTPGQVSLSASYSGNPNNKQSSGSAVLTVGSLETQKSGIASNIKNLESAITDSSINKNLDRAALHVQKSAASNLWNTDATTLDVKKGKKVFDQEAKAVNVLLNLLKTPTSNDDDMKNPQDDDTNDQDLASTPTSALPTGVTNSIRGIINNLESIDGTLAQGQISSANAHLAYLQSHNAPSNKITQVQQGIAQANSFIQKAQSDLAAGNFHRAIFDYREAWAAATQSIGIN